VTEIRLDVELAHPPERVWRALTDARLLGDWFLAGDLEPRTGHRFRLESAGGHGDGDIDGEVVEVLPQRRLVMHWRAADLDARVAFVLNKASNGCQLTLRQSGFFGVQGTLRRRALHREYAHMLGRRLPEVLSRLADEDSRHGPVGAALARRQAQRARNGGEPLGRRNAGRLFQRGRFGGRRLRAIGRVRVSRPLNLEKTVALAASRVPRRHAAAPRGRRARRSGLHRWWMARRAGLATTARLLLPRAASALRGGPDTDAARNRAIAVGAGLVLVIGVTSLIVVGSTIRHPAGPPQVGGSTDSPEPTFTQAPASTAPRSAPASRAGSGAPSASGFSGPATVGSPLTAVYRIEARLGGYRGTVTITNPTATVISDWRVEIRVPLLATVREAIGAEFTQTGQVVVFTPKSDSRYVQPRDTVSFTLEVDGVGESTECTIDGKPCSAG